MRVASFDVLDFIRKRRRMGLGAELVLWK